MTISSEVRRYIEWRLGAADDELARARAEIRMLNALLSKSQLASASLANSLNEGKAEERRRGLRSRGRTRAVFECVARSAKGATVATLAELHEVGSKLKKLRMVCRSAEQQGYFVRRGGRYFMTAKGIALLERSMPYCGEIQSRQKRRANARSSSPLASA